MPIALHIDLDFDDLDFDTGLRCSGRAAIEGLDGHIGPSSIPGKGTLNAAHEPADNLPASMMPLGVPAGVLLSAVLSPVQVALLPGCR